MDINIELMKRRLLVKYPLFGSIVANLKYIETRECETAGTDGKNVYFNPDFIQGLSEDEQTFVFAHEVCHVAFNHILRSEGKDQEIWNIATDAVINAFLEQDGLEIVKGGVNIPEAINYNAEEMYEKLLEEKRKEKKDNSNSNKDVGHDTHSMWDKAIEKKKQEEQEKNSSKISETEEEKREEETIKRMAEIGEKEAFEQNKIERKRQLDELRESLAKESIGAGDSTNSIDRKITDIGASRPLVDWRKLLKEAVKVEMDWSYRNASIEEGVVTPHLEEIPQPETEILLDTSGSINRTLLKNFLRECKNILKTSKVKVGCFDTKFYGFQEIRNENDIDNMRFVGGGGTNFDVAVNAFSRRVENKIIFTDGDSAMPEKSIDAIWIVFGGIKINPRGGKVISITDKQLKELCHYVQETNSEDRSR